MSGWDTSEHTNVRPGARQLAARKVYETFSKISRNMPVVCSQLLLDNQSLARLRRARDPVASHMKRLRIHVTFETKKRSVTRFSMIHRVAKVTSNRDQSRPGVRVAAKGGMRKRGCGQPDGERFTVWRPPALRASAGALQPESHATGKRQSTRLEHGRGERKAGY